MPLKTNKKIDENTQLYPLSSSQHLIFFAMKYYKKSAFNLASMVNFEAEIDKDLMNQAMMFVILRNRSSLIRIRKTKEGPRQYYSNSVPDMVIVDDLSDMTPERFEATVRKWTAAQMTEIYDKQLLQYRMVKRPGGLWSIYICASHLIYDGPALALTLIKIVETYSKLVRHETVEEWTSDPMALYEAEWKYLKSGAVEKDNEYFRNELFPDEPYYTNVVGGGYGRIKGKRYGKVMNLLNRKGEYIIKNISAGLTDKINELSRELTVSPEDVYLYALRSYLAGVNDTDDVTMLDNFSRRFNAVQRDAGGNAATAFFYRSRYPREMTSRDAIIATRTLRSTYYRHCKRTPDADLIKIISRFAPEKPRMYMYYGTMFMYQGYELSCEPAVPYNYRPYSSGVALQMTYFMVLMRNPDGSTPLNYAISKAMVTRETVDYMHTKMTEILEKITSNPDATVGEVADISKR